MKSLVSLNTSQFEVVDNTKSTTYNKDSVSDILKKTYSVLIVFSTGNTEEFTLLETETTEGSGTPFNTIDELYIYVTTTVVAIVSGTSDVTVRPDGSGLFDSIKAACDYAGTLASVSTPQIVDIVGAYNEDPFVIPAYTKLNIKSGSITANNSTEPLITMSGAYSELRGGNIVGPSASDTVNVTVGNTSIKDVVISASGICGVRVTGLGLSRLLIRNTTLVGGVNGVCIDGSFVVFTTASSTNTSGSAIQINNNSTVIVDSFVAALCTLDLEVLDANSSVSMNASQINIDKIYAVSYDNLQLAFNSSKEGDEANENLQEVHVGIPERGREFRSGEGESYTRGMLVYSETDLGVFTDRSTEAASTSGSTFGFDGNITDNAIYIASSLNGSLDSLTHYGIKTFINTAAVYGAGSIVLEYWNGIAWVSLNGNDRDGNPPYISHAKQYFTTLGSTQLRYNILLSADSWTKNNPMGLSESYYWVRFRIATDVTTTPIFEQIKLHTNAFETNSDGFREFFGNARSLGQLPINIGQAKPIAGNMQSQTLWIDQNVGVGFTTNKFTATNDILGWNFLLPFDADSSSPISFVWGGLPSQAAVIQWTIRLSYIEAGVGALYDSDPGVSSNPNTTIEVINPGATTLGVANTYSTELDISDAIERRLGKPGDLVFITIQPTILSGTFSLVGAGATYAKWSDGGHI